MPELTSQDLQRLKDQADKGWLPGPGMFWRLVDTLERAQQRMPTRVEVYPLAVEDDRVWMLDPPRAWMSPEVEATSEPDLAAKIELAARDTFFQDSGALHQTSCRTEIVEETGRSFQVDTFLAAVPLDGPILARWPDAEPITAGLLAELGPAEPHGAMEVPWVSDADVLQHGLGVLAELMGSSVRSDPESAARLDALGFRGPLAQVEEQMFKHFRRSHRAA